ncbi:hypothetical protein, partial [Burkholderia ubonensis]|uniref:hypothetical protein n=1 Tax=Burkholderia ubonensis TaxID=101571 RepID=UPI001C431BA8
EMGVGMHMGMAEVLPDLQLSDIFTQADLELDRSKNASVYPKFGPLRAFGRPTKIVFVGQSSGIKRGAG